MQTFANKFSIALNQNKTEAIINFYQVIPTLPEDAATANTHNVPTELGATTLPVANLVMSGECAELLAKGLSELFQR